MSKYHMTRGYGLLENFLAKKRAQIADRVIPKKLRNGRILDIGCGSVPFFLINTKFREKYGMDPAIKISGLRNAVLKKFDIEKGSKIPFKDDFFDIITMLAVFEHISPGRLVHIIKDIKRMLKPGGRFILTTPCPWTDKLLRIMAKLKLVSIKEIKEHKDAYSKCAVAKYLYKAGFEKKKMKFGYFEVFLNIWAYADK